MGLFQRLVTAFFPPDQLALAVPPDYDIGYANGFLGGAPASTASGRSVTAESALRVTTVLACTRVIAEGVAQLPFKLYRSDHAGHSAPADDVSLYRILHRRPNGWMTSFQFRELLTTHTVLTGNGFAVKNYVRGQLDELIPVMPDRVVVKQHRDLSLSYEVLGSDNRLIPVRQQDMFHLRGPSWDGWNGLRIVKEAREAIGLSMAAEESQAKLQAKGSRTGGILKVEEPLTAEQIGRIRQQWNETQAAYDTAVFDQKMSWQSTSMSGVDAQTLETRRFQIEEICRAMRVFPQMVMSSDKTSTYASAEQFFLAHGIHTLGPWIQRWEETVEAQLLPDGAKDLFVKMSMQGLLRGAAADRANFYQSGITNGWLTRNEARRLEDLEPLDGLDVPLVPLNMGPSGSESADADV